VRIDNDLSVRRAAGGREADCAPCGGMVPPDIGRAVSEPGAADQDMADC